MARADDEGRDELERQIREHYGTWRGSPPGRYGCLLIAVFVLLTTGAAVFLGVVLLLRA